MRILHRSVALFAVLAVTLGVVAMAVPAQAVASGANGWVSFVSDRTGSRQIYIMRSDGTAQTKLTSAGSNWDPAWSPDGLSIAFVSDRDGSTELYTMAYDGTAQTRITNNTTMTESHPTWSPKGNEVAFAGKIGTDSDIYRMTLGANTPRDMTADPVAFDANPSWSAGGLDIVFDSTNRGGDAGTNIWKVRQNTRVLTQLTTDGKDSNPSWAPDNSTVVFESTRDTVVGGPSVFASVTKPDGILALSDKILVTQFNKDTIRKVDASGNVAVWANLPSTGNKSVERYMALSPGAHGFTAGNIFATVGPDIYEITPDGLTVSLFTHISALPNGETGITFDTVGTFGFKMILTDRRGPVWTVDSAGNATQIGDFLKQIETPKVAPADWAPYGGQLLGATELPGTVWAMDSAGVISRVADWAGAEGEIQIPSTACNLTGSNSSFFISMEDQNQIMAFPASQFAGLGGDWLAPSETNTDIGVFHSDGSNVTISQFWGPLGIPDMEGFDFAPCTSAGAGVKAAAPTAIGREIYSMHDDGTNQVRLTNNASDDRAPAVSPSGKTVVFQSDRDDPNYPGCESSATCAYQLFTMDLVNGGSQTDISNGAGNNTSGDWQAASAPLVSVIDFKFKPATNKPKLGGSVVWDFIGPSDHDVTDSSGMVLFDSGTKPKDSLFMFKFDQAGNYPYVCELHPLQMTGTVNVALTATPKTGGVTTVFTVTWGTANPKAGYVVDVQILRPGQTVFADWKTGTTQKASTFTPDGGVGTYSFRSRLRKVSGGASNYSAPATITVS